MNIKQAGLQRARRESFVSVRVLFREATHFPQIVNAKNAQDPTEILASQAMKSRALELPPPPPPENVKIFQEPFFFSDHSQRPTFPVLRFLFINQDRRHVTLNILASTP